MRCVRGADEVIRSAVGSKLFAGDVADGFCSVLSPVLLLILPLLIFLGLVLILVFIGVGGTVLALAFAKLDAARPLIPTASDFNYIDDDDNSILLI